jgi:hypothetical protein
MASLELLAALFLPSLRRVLRQLWLPLLLLVVVVQLLLLLVVLQGL